MIGNLAKRVLFTVLLASAIAAPGTRASAQGEATSIVAAPLRAPNGTIPSRLNTFRFVGAPVNLPVGAGSQVVVSASLPVAVLTGAKSILVDYDICIKTASTAIRNTGGDTYFQTATVTPSYAVLAVSTVFTLRTADRYSIGFCARNKNATLVDHDVLRGFVQIMR